MSTSKSNLTPPSISLKDSQSDNLTGHFLIAMPYLQDRHFYQTVTLICEHNEEGLMGVTLNRPSQYLMAELFKELDVSSHNKQHGMLYEGGPVQPESGFILHRNTDNKATNFDDETQQWESTTVINSELALTSSKDIIEAIAKGTGPKDYHIALGYSGWSTEQFNNEMKENSWLTMPATADQIFNNDVENLWLLSAQWLGINMSQLPPHSGRA